MRLLEETVTAALAGGPGLRSAPVRVVDAAAVRDISDNRQREQIKAREPESQERAVYRCRGICRCTLSAIANSIKVLNMIHANSLAVMHQSIPLGAHTHQCRRRRPQHLAATICARACIFLGARLGGCRPQLGMGPHGKYQHTMLVSRRPYACSQANS